jgi:hypothetical protein
MDTQIQIGPTGRKLLPLTPLGTTPRVPGHSHEATPAVAPAASHG